MAKQKDEGGWLLWFAALLIVLIVYLKYGTR